MFSNLVKKIQLWLLENASLGTAGQVVYYDPTPVIFDNGTIILAAHTTGADKTAQAAQTAWECLPPEIKKELEDNKIGFAVRQI